MERKHIELLRLAFELHYPGEDYLPTPIFFDLRSCHEDRWIRCEILSRKLRAISIRCAYCPRKSDTEMLSTLSAKAPMLEQLRLSGGWSCISALDTMSGFERLQLFQCDQVIKVTMLQSLASLPHLLTLDILLPLDPVPESLAISSVSNHFPSLKSVHVASNQLASLAQFMRLYATTSPIEDTNFSLDWSNGGRYTSPPELPLNGLRSLLSGSAHCLTTFHFAGSYHSSQVWSAWRSLTFREIRPLLLCKGLQSLHIDAGYMLENFDNSALKAMAAAWPQLQSLKLISFPIRMPMPCTIHCLKYMARFCPDLQSLSISFSIVDKRLKRAKLGPSGGQLSLKSLHVGLSTLSDDHVKTVASFLLRLFPALGEISTAEDRRNKNRRAWEEVLRLLRSS